MHENLILADAVDGEFGDRDLTLAVRSELNELVFRPALGPGIGLGFTDDPPAGAHGHPVEERHQGTVLPERPVAVEADQAAGIPDIGPVFVVEHNIPRISKFPGPLADSAERAEELSVLSEHLDPLVPIIPDIHRPLAVHVEPGAPGEKAGFVFLFADHQVFDEVEDEFPITRFGRIADGFHAVDRLDLGLPHSLFGFFRTRRKDEKRNRRENQNELPEIFRPAKDRL